MRRLLLFTFSLLLLNSCDTEDVLPDGAGRDGEVMVVISQQNWENSVGTAIRDVLQSEQTGLPQSEAMFTVVRVPPQGFDGTFQRVRNVVIVEVEEGTAGATIKENVWANDQVVIRLSAPDPETLTDVITTNREKIRQTLYQNDFRRIRERLSRTRDIDREKEIYTKNGFSMWVPAGFKLVQNEEDFTWYKQSLQKKEGGQVYDITKSVWVHSEPYTGPEQLNKVAIAERRNRITKQYVEGPVDSSFMQLLPGFPHEFHELELNGRQAYEIKGLWNMNGARMGGPYVTYSFVDEGKKMLYTVDGFIFAPNTEKRDYVRELEAIISTISFTEPQDKKSK